jgi:diguanylate cyclase (GGDEF)-like protein
MHLDSPTTRYRLYWGLGLTLLFNGMLLAWLLLKPGPHALVAAVDNGAQCVGPLLVLPLCVRGAPRPRGLRGGGAGAARWVPLLLGLGVLTDTIGQSIWTYYEQILHHPTPFPSWDDVAYLSTYPLLLLGLLLLPARPLSAAGRVRLALDGLMLMTAVVTFSWYFILGPILRQGSETLLAKSVGTAYPLCDLVLIFCLFLLATRSTDAALHMPLRLLASGLLIIVAADSIFDYQTLHGTYATGELIDVGWPLGDMLIGLAAYGVRCGLARAPVQRRPEDMSAHVASARASPLWQAMLPYALVPAVGALALVTWHTRGAAALKAGVYLGGAVLVALVLLRQVLALLENRRLYRYLHAAYTQLDAAYHQVESKNSALAEANTRLQALAITDPLTDLPNHRAMVAALDRELERAQRYRRPCALLFIDLDHFKALNDGYGHPAGDAALRDLAVVVRGTVRDGDILGRWGGEEFVLLLPETDPAMALAAAERVRAAVAAHRFRAGSGVHLTCSVGVATYPHDGQTRDSLVDAADRAMYAAKRLGRNQVRAATDPAVAALTAAPNTDGSREEIALAGTVEALAALVDARDQYTGQHSQDVATLTMRVAFALGCDAAEVRMIGLAARLHDVGKIAVPDAVLQQPGRLSAEEWGPMRMHPIVGADVVSRVPALRALAPVIRAHHERWDGGGYPDGLAGDAIPLGARIVAVVDAYSAMTTDRPYRQGRDAAWALAELRRCAGTQFDATVVEALARVLEVGLGQARQAHAG